MPVRLSLMSSELFEELQFKYFTLENECCEMGFEPRETRAKILRHAIRYYSQGERITKEDSRRAEERAYSVGLIVMGSIIETLAGKHTPTPDEIDFAINFAETTLKTIWSSFMTI